MPTAISHAALIRAGYAMHSAAQGYGRFWSKVMQDGRGGQYRITVYELRIRGVSYGHDVVVMPFTSTDGGQTCTPIASDGFSAATIEGLEARAAAFVAGAA